MGGFSLTGVVTTQTVFYFQHYPEDKAPAKVMVRLPLSSYRLADILTPVIGRCCLVGSLKIRSRN
jgi:hypothetical protein